MLLMGWIPEYILRTTDFTALPEVP